MNRFVLYYCLAIALTAHLAFAASYRPRTLDEKVQEADLIVFGRVTLSTLPLDETSGPVKRQCEVEIIEQIWPPKLIGEKKFKIDKWVWRKWPKTWWDYNSSPGIYFLKRNGSTWVYLERFDDWYEPTEQRHVVKAAVEKLRHKPRELSDIQSVRSLPSKDLNGESERQGMHVVQQGDTLWKIAQERNVSVGDIVKNNGLENPDIIKIGQVLLLSSQSGR